MAAAVSLSSSTKSTSQDVVKKQKCYHLWRIDPKEVTDRHETPFAKGGFGKVSMAKYKDKFVAVKVLFCRLVKNDLVAFQTEIDIWHKLEHPNILPLLGACDTETEIPFMVSPFMFNGTLNAHLASRPSDAEKVRIMSQVASGMAYLHENNIIHGDISSMNILLDENFHAVVSDFGLARTKHISSSSNYATHGHKPAGTLQYMAPEMLDWTKPSGPLGSSKKTDVYAYGILFYEVLVNGGAVWVTDDHQLMDTGRIVGCVLSGQRPERDRPDLELPISDDGVWSLIQACWLHAAQDRPSLAQVFSMIVKAHQYPNYGSHDDYRSWYTGVL